MGCELFWLVQSRPVVDRRVAFAQLCSGLEGMRMPRVRPAEQFAANMKRLRDARGHSQEDFAHLAHLHRTEVTKLESGKRDPRLATIVKVAEGLDVPLDQLLAKIGKQLEQDDR